MRFKPVYLAVLLLAWVQCSSGPRPTAVASIDLNWASRQTLSWSFECGFPIKHRAAARAGFYYWDGIAGRKLFEEKLGCVSVMAKSQVELVVRTDEVDSINKATRFATAGRIGDLKEISYYYLWTDLSDWPTQVGAARHEAGHVLGLNHSSDDRCLMFSTISPFLNMAKQACDEEVALIRKTYGWRR